MGPGSATLTPRGWGLLATAGALALCGFLFGIRELYPVAAAAAVLVFGARIWVAGRTWDLRVSRFVRPSRVPAGSDVRVDLTIRNHDTRRSPVVAVDDRFPGAGRRARFILAPLEPGETRVGSYRLSGSRRGMFEIGPLELELNDPFGLARVTRGGCPESVLSVHPRFDRITPRSISTNSDRDRRMPLPVLGRGGDEFYGLREYQPGDDPRQVHWVSTARFDELMIRQPENVWRGRLTVAVDLRSTVHRHGTFEPALSAAASVALAGLRAGLHVRLVTTTGVSTGFGPAGLHEATILDALAVAEPHAGTSLAESLRLDRRAGALTVITTDAASRGDLAFVSMSGGQDRATLVTFGSPELAGGPVAETGTSRVRRVHVPSGSSFRTAWEGAPC
jgi:uncharacterized protein (DUF58 family)